MTQQPGAASTAQSHDDGVPLRAIVVAVLTACMEAKRLADAQSAQLAEAYRVGDLSLFAVPAFGFSSIQVELHCAVMGLDSSGDLMVEMRPAKLRDIDLMKLQTFRLTIDPLTLRVHAREHAK